MPTDLDDAGLRGMALVLCARLELPHRVRGDEVPDHGRECWRVLHEALLDVDRMATAKERERCAQLVEPYFGKDSGLYAAIRAADGTVAREGGDGD